MAKSDKGEEILECVLWLTLISQLGITILKIHVHFLHGHRQLVREVMPDWKCPNEKENPDPSAIFPGSNPFHTPVVPPQIFRHPKTRSLPEGSSQKVL